MRLTPKELRRLYSTHRWQKTRQFIKDRDGWRCTKCGKAGVLEVHHLQSPFFGGPMWDLANLRTLCKKCHFAEHRAGHLNAMTPERRAWWEFINDGAA